MKNIFNIDFYTWSNHQSNKYMDLFGNRFICMNRDFMQDSQNIYFQCTLSLKATQKHDPLEYNKSDRG